MCVCCDLGVAVNWYRRPACDRRTVAAEEGHYVRDFGGSTHES